MYTDDEMVEDDLYLKNKKRYLTRLHSQKQKKYLKELSTYCSYKSGSYLCTFHYDIKNHTISYLSKPYYKRWYRRKSVEYFKSISNRKIRHYTKELPLKGTGYKKIYDLWWNTY